jgi:hypothetical protein
MKMQLEGIRGRFPSKQFAEEIWGNITADLNHCKENLYTRRNTRSHTSKFSLIFKNRAHTFRLNMRALA